MKEWKKVAVSPDITIKKTIDVIDRTALQIALVVDSEDRLLGTVTDGDIRRGLLRGCELSDSIETVYHRQPMTASADTPMEHIHSRMKRYYLKHLPVVDSDGRIVSLEILKNILSKDPKKSPVVLMAGGLGSRLRPLTDDCPKPLLKVGGKPILEIILEKFVDEGFQNFFISINYMGDSIRKYFGDGSRWDVSIEYLEENQRLGTAGGLSLFSELPDEPVIVMNGDLLTKISFNALLNFHKDSRASATMCVREHEVSIPYGVVRAESARLIELQEKPVQKILVNAGIYVLSPEALRLIPENQYFDMTELFNQMIELNWHTSVYQIKEYWIDIGRMKDFEMANVEFGKFFSS
ncbi:nucleotidyltransferase family protein [Desulforegula conservatrix]|uniref:nucleotidyltransferase family protein n=1 Tax=Desulforegula conservatrix TaxID=153026 RepID=UPI0004278BF8|nr:nucleotidyltransferase family protein [Desulforegula conservatrix]